MSTETTATPASVGLPTLIPRATLFGNPVKAGAKISPDGTKLAYLAPLNDVLNIWVRSLDADDDQAITASDRRPIRQCYWQGDSAHLLYLQDRDGDENYHLYQVELATHTVRDLTPYEGARATPISVDPLHPDQILVGLNVRDPRLHDAYRIDVKTGEATLDTENPGDVAGWIADHRLQVRAAQVIRPDGGTEIRARDDVYSPWHVVMAWDMEETMGGVQSFAPDNRGLWLLSSVNANASRLIELDTTTGQTTVLSEDPQYDLSGLLTHPRTHELEAVQYARDRSEWTLLQPALEADFNRLSSYRHGDIAIVSRNLDDTVWIVTYTVDDGPVYYYAYRRGAEQEPQADRHTLLFSTQPDLETYRLAEMLPVTFPARDGLVLHSYLTLPVGLEPRDLPLVLLVHGGPWYRDTWGYNPSVQWLVNRGYAVLQINFRGSTGYGKAYLNAGNREWVGAMRTDLLDGKQWAIDRGIAAPGRVAIMGGSYGGYATLVALAYSPDEFVCGVDIVGPSNIFTLFASIPPYWEPLKALFLKRVGDPETEPEFIREISPLFKADRITAPLLIAQGANDPRVKQAESDQIVAAMRQNGQPVEYLVFPDEGHGFARPENTIRFSAAAEAFLAKYLGGRSEPPAAHESVEELRR